MLDALISQLPGAKIDDSGRITVNGEFVESLLLNGKEFFNNDHQIMLENIGAYTVKTIEVYKGQTLDEKWKNDQRPPSHLTMDVKLKKEYSIGWIVNAMAGYGTEDRYIGRLFASWFSPTTSVNLIGNINNLNSTRMPGKNDSWTPEKMPSGHTTSQMLGINVDYRSTDQKTMCYGNAWINGNFSDNNASTSRTNFLSSGNTFDRSFTNAHNNNFSAYSNGSVYFKPSNLVNIGIGAFGEYHKSDNRNSSISATFDKDYLDLSREALESIYSAPSAGVLESIINRSITRSDGSTKGGSFRFSPFTSVKLPTGDYLSANISVGYQTDKNYAWNDYTINFGSDPQAAERRRQYIDNTPNRAINLDGQLTYSMQFNNIYLSLSYQYTFENSQRNSSMFALDRLEDLGIYGILPDGYLTTFDPNNSYTSSTYKNTHSLLPFFMYSKKFSKSMLRVMTNPRFALRHSHLDYWRANRSYLVKRSDFLIRERSYQEQVKYSFAPAASEQPHYNHSIAYQVDLESSAPELLHLVDVINDADPLNIQEGNPNLHNAFRQKHKISYYYQPYGKPFNNIIHLSAEFISNALVRGYIYDTSTGVRRNRTYNVDGNRNYQALDFFNLEFGSKKQFTIASATDVTYMNNTDMIGINQQEAQKSLVHNLTLGEDLIFTYKFGKQQISAQATVSHRQTTSDRTDFSNINAQHYKYGVSGIFSLPAGFGISTDFFFYKRAGYGVKSLDTTDAVWNLRLTYATRNNKWVFTADGFDLLHQLANIHYAVTATGRTVTYTNTLPRYMLLSAQYKFSVQPRK